MYAYKLQIFDNDDWFDIRSSNDLKFLIRVMVDFKKHNKTSHYRIISVMFIM